MLRQIIQVLRDCLLLMYNSFRQNMLSFDLCIISSMWWCTTNNQNTDVAMQCCVRCTTESWMPCASRALYWYSPVYKWVLKQNKTKEEAKWRTTKKKNWKNLVFNLNRAKLSRYHRVSERERERTVTRECSCHSQPPCTVTREKTQLYCTQTVYICTLHSLTTPHTLPLSGCININLLTNHCLISRPPQINTTQSSLTVCSVCRGF